jgi:hypothetical protein
VPLVSHFCVHCPGLDFHRTGPKIVATDTDLVLLRVPMGGSDWDYFVYRPRAQWLDLLPNWQHPGCTTGKTASAESTNLCQEPKAKLTARDHFDESFSTSSRHRNNPRYRPSVPRGNRAGSRHSYRLTTQRHYDESCRSRPSAQPGPHDTTERPSRPLARPSNVPRADP